MLGAPESESTLRASELAAVRNDNWLRGLPRLGANSLNLLYHIHAIRHTPEDNVLSVKPRCLHCAKEELRAVRIRSSICHRKDASTSVLQREILVGKLRTVDGLPTCTVA